MKKILALAFALLLSISVSAQTPLTEAVNFSSTAHNGEEINLKRELMEKINSCNGESVVLTIDRGGEVFDLKITPAKNKDGFYKILRIIIYICAYCVIFYTTLLRQCIKRRKK